MFNSAGADCSSRSTAPGVPDIYQGTELWDFSLVDPDNRRPVDYERRQALLAQLQLWTTTRPAAARAGRGIAASTAS